MLYTPFLPKIDGLLKLPTIQQAIDDQCGKGRAIADLEGFHNDPVDTWKGQSVQCFYDDLYNKAWVCNC